MEIDFKENKGFRLLQLYERLSRGEIIRKAELAQKFSVTDKTIQRDIEELRAYLAETRTDEGEASIVYSKHMTAQHTIRIVYCRQDGAERTHEVNPVAIMFSEYYFYLIAYLADGRREFPTIFRIDRIAHFEVTGATFRVVHKKKFSDGEFRKRIQFMYAGELRRVTFDYSGTSVEAVLDRLPTAKVVSEKNGVHRITAEVYGNGIDMWLRSQGEVVKVVNA